MVTGSKWHTQNLTGNSNWNELAVNWRKGLNTHKNVEQWQNLPKNTKNMSIKRKRLSDDAAASSSAGRQTLKACYATLYGLAAVTWNWAAQSRSGILLAVSGEFFEAFGRSCNAMWNDKQSLWYHNQNQMIESQKFVKCEINVMTWQNITYWTRNSRRRGKIKRSIFRRTCRWLLRSRSLTHPDSPLMRCEILKRN